MDKLKALHTFVEIVDRGSLTAAAEAMDSSLPAVVRTLAALEAQLGVRLLHRTTRRIALTEDGRQYVERARRILADVDEADRLLGAEQVAPSGALHVTAPVLFGQYHIAPAVTRFLQQHPAMRVQLTLLDRVVNLIEEGMDVGIRIGHLQDSSLVAQRVGEIRRVVVASPALLRRRGVPAHPRELADAPCLCFSGMDGRRWLFREGSRALGIVVNGPMESNLAAPILDACVAGLGFTRCLSYQAAPLLAARRLRVVLQDYEVEPWPIHITYPSARLLPSRTRVFIEWIKRTLQESASAFGAASSRPRKRVPRRQGI
jgi:DNA-binding transcriptional LysR family regulator